MPVSNDNQDFGESDKKNKEQDQPETSNEMTSDNLKGKKVDADLELDTDKPLEEKK